MCVQDPGLRRSRMGGIGGNNIVLPWRNLEKMSTIVGNQLPVGPLGDVVIFFSKQREGIMYVRDNIDCINLHVVFCDCAKSDSSADGIDEDILGFSWSTTEDGQGV